MVAIALFVPQLNLEKDMRQPLLKSLAVAVLATAALAGHAADAPVTNAVIVGSGIGNNDFTIGLGGNIELGLRARERYAGAGPLYSPTNNTYNNDTNTYNHAPGGFTAVGSDGTSPGPRGSWNFDWSINTKADGTGTNNVGAYTYLLSLDSDPGVGITYQSFDPVNGAPNDNSFGNNSTGQGDGEEAGVTPYATLVAQSNLVQNSWNYAFFPTLGFNPDTNGTYTIRLQAFAVGGALLAESLINVNVGAAAVPEPGSIALVGLALGGLALVRRRKLKA